MNNKLKNKHPVSVLAIAVLLGAILRFYRLGYQSIWGDEALTLQKYAVGDNLAQFFSNAWQNAFHPPLYFLIINLWRDLGESELMIRLPSALFGIAAIPVMYMIVKRLFGVSYAGIAALVLAVSPFHLWYSQEARMYSLLILLALGSMLAFLKAWETRRARDLAFYGIVSLLGLFTHISFLLVIASQGIFTLGTILADKRRSLSYILVQFLVLLAFFPWMLHSLGGRVEVSNKVIGFERQSSPMHLAYGLYTFAVGYSLGPTVVGLHYSGAREVIKNNLPEIAVPMVVFGLLLSAGMLEVRRANRTGYWFISAHLFVPLVLISASVVFSWIPLNPRYLMAAMPSFLILISVGSVLLFQKRSTQWVPALGVLIVGLSIYNHYFQVERFKQDMRSAVQFVNERARPGDVIIISSIELGGPFIYYSRMDNIPYVGYPPKPGLVEPEKISGDMKLTLEGKERAWLILGRTWSSDPDGLIGSYFKSHYTLVSGSNFTGVNVSCFKLEQDW